MYCYSDLAEPVPLFSVVYSLPANEGWTVEYLFAGESPAEAALLRKLDAVRSGAKGSRLLSAAEEKRLKKAYPNYAKDWLIAKHPIRLVPDFIQLDDNVKIVRKKIFTYLSDPATKDFVLEENQELTMELADGTFRVLGFYYPEQEDESYHAYRQTHPLGEIEIDDNFVDETGLKKITEAVVNKNDIIMYDVFDYETTANPFVRRMHTLYLYNVQAEAAYLEDQGVVIDNRVRFGFLERYFPMMQLNIPDGIAKEYTDEQEKIHQRRYLAKLLADAKIDYSPDCGIIDCNFYINSPSDVSVDYVDLLKIYNHLRYQLSERMPFIAYNDPEWDMPYFSVHQKSVESGVIDKRRLQNWTFSVDREVGVKLNVKGLVIKLFNTKYETGVKYSTVILYRNGFIEYRVSFASEFGGGSVAAIREKIDQLNALLRNINKIDYRLVVDQKIPLPSIRMENKHMVLSPNLRIVSLASYGTFKWDGEVALDFAEMSEFSRLFFPYLILPEDVATRDFLRLKYKKISGIESAGEIYNLIATMKLAGADNNAVIRAISTNFHMTIGEAYYTLREMLKGISSTEELLQARYIGVDVVISHGKFIIRGIKNMYQLYSITQFVNAFIHMYQTVDMSNKKLKTLLKQYTKYMVEETEDIYKNEVEPEALIDMNLDIANINIDEFGINVPENVLLPGNVAAAEQETETETRQRGTGTDLDVSQFAPDSAIDVNIRLKCADKIEDTDACRDLCNDNSYFLRRLQRMDNRIFKFSDPKFPQYSKGCQAGKQPVPVKYDPDNTPGVDRTAFTYTFRYGSSPDNQNYYICPTAWCPTCNKPINMKDVRGIETKTTAVKTGKCTVGKCPNGDHQVYVKIDEYKEYVYPGFHRNSNPYGYCMPCCYTKDKRDQPKYRECLGEEVGAVEETDVSYILSYQMGTTPENRYSLLSPDIYKLFRNRCQSGPMVSGQSCYVRRGVELTSYQTFQACFAKLLGVDSLDEFKKMMVKRLTPKLFQTLHNGLLEIAFRDRERNISAYDNYRAYLQSTEILVGHEYLWDFFSRPGVIGPKGYNIIIFTPTTIICPLGEDLGTFYDAARPTIFVFKYKRFYEPIVKVEYVGGDVVDKWEFGADDVDGEDGAAIVAKVMDILSRKCQPTHLNWERILRDNERELGITYDRQIRDEISLQKTMLELKNAKGAGISADWKVVGQIVDPYNKTTALQLKNGVYLPVLPTGPVLGMDVIDNPRLAEYGKTVHTLSTIATKTDIPCRPVGKINNDGKTVAIVLETLRIVPVKPTAAKRDKLEVRDISYFADADVAIATGEQLSDKRQQTMLKYQYEEESFERLRYEVSKYLQLHPKEVVEIEDIIENVELDMNQKRTAMLKIVKGLMKKLVISKPREIDLQAQFAENLRRTCASKKTVAICHQDTHCAYDGKKCKLYIVPINLITGKNNLQVYAARLVEELLRYQLKSKSILYDRIEDIIDRKRVDVIPGELLIPGDESKIVGQIDEIYRKRDKIHIDTGSMYDTAEPLVDLDLLQKLNNDVLYIEPLTPYWTTEVFGKDFKVYKSNFENESLYYSVARAIQALQANVKKTVSGTEKMDAAKIKELVARYISEMGLSRIREVMNRFDCRDQYILDQYNRDQDALFNYLTSDLYNPTILDIYVLVIVLGVNIIILEKELTANRGDYRCLRINEDKPYILLYHYMDHRTNIYDILNRDGQYVFEFVELPKKFHQIFTRKCITVRGKMS